MNLTFDEYIGLITSEHILAPKFMSMVNDGLAPIFKLQQVISSMPLEFDIDNAIGIQLDAVGQWIGRDRRVAIPIVGVYFTWDDTVTTGWDSGVWKSDFDPDSGLTLLPDEAYRVLLKAKIAANTWDGSIPGAYEVWQQAFGNSSQIVIQDNQDMSFIIAIFGLPLDPVTLALLTGGYIPLKPEGVRIASYDVAPDNGAIFAFDVDNDLLKGWDEGSWPIEIIPA